ncbi:UNVERIFIED_CONTAM: Wall-associated receptor kinase-like 8 [Sesamum angustifolium]|uniref:Wall-associated receptor kinase-like 8 n=1 Tax=Sesamum angustifolium TaxID=2727405 RepID=A0AAW2M5V2_9LAMI
MNLTPTGSVLRLKSGPGLTHGSHLFKDLPPPTTSTKLQLPSTRYLFVSGFIDLSSGEKSITHKRRTLVFYLLFLRETYAIYINAFFAVLSKHNPQISILLCSFELIAADFSSLATSWFGLQNQQQTEVIEESTTLNLKELTKKMAPDHCFLLAFLIICSASTALLQAVEIKAEAPMVTASGDCQRKCGDIEVPYPFGMSKGCYLDETFRVICNESTGSAFLTLLGWEVESINISTHTLRHKNFRGVTIPFTSSRGPHRQGPGIVLVSLQPQRHSPCAAFVLFRPVLLRDKFPETLRNLSVWVQRTDYMTKAWENQCGIFTFVEKDFLSLNNMKFSTCNESYVVPMIHEWAVGDTGCNKARESIAEYLCGQNTRCIDYYPAQGYRCECNNGYQGNAYLPQGCQDVDECSNPEDNNCPAKTHCVNTEGGYFCLPNRRRMLELLIPLGIGLGVGLLILVAIGIWTWRKLKQIKERKMKQKFFRRNGGLLLQQRIFSTRGSALLELTLFKIEELEKATDNFSGSRVLGKGGHGTVYNGNVIRWKNCCRKEG